jgi:P pilus assembly chaperone PapD
MKKAIVIIIALTLLILLPSATSAQTGIKVWPTKVELAINRGETTESAINVQNQGSETIRVRAYVMDFSIHKDGNYAFSEPGHESYSAAKWLSLNETEFDLAPGESNEIDVTIAVPAAVEPGGHYAALFVETVPVAASEGVSVLIASRIPSLFYLTIPGVTEADIVANADIASLILPGLVESGPVETSVVIRNTGNVHLTVAARAYFSDIHGAEIDELDLGQIVILPQSEQTMKGSWEDVPFLGKARVSVVVGYFNQQGELVNKTRTADFWIIPWKLGVIIVASIIFFIFMIRLAVKRYRLRIERR